MEREATVDKYCEAWGVADESARRALLSEVWAANGVYEDPSAHVRGLDELVGMIGAVHQRFPGGRIERLSAIDQHHDCARFEWRFAGPDGATILDGIDFVTFAGDKIEHITGFFGVRAAARAA